MDLCRRFAKIPILKARRHSADNTVNPRVARELREDGFEAISYDKTCNKKGSDESE